MSKCLRVGRKKQLDDTDLPNLPLADTIHSLRRAGEADTSPIEHAEQVIGSIIRQERWEFVFCALMCLVSGGLQIVTPLLFHAFIYSYDCTTSAEPVLLVTYLPDYCEDLAYSSVLAVVLLIVIFITDNARNLHHYSATHVGQRVRSRVIALVFQKYMTMRPDCRPSTGEVLSIATNEGQMFVDGLQFINYVWVGILQTGLMTFFLYQLLGIYGVLGIAIYFLIVPLCIVLTALSKRIRAKRKVEADVRIKRCSEMLLGMRVIKYFAWESAYLERIDSSRKREVRLVRNEFLVITTLWMCSAVIPMTGMAVSILGYVFSGGEMHPSTVFGSVSLFISLRFLLLKMGSVITSVVSLSVARRRITRFLNLPSRAFAIPLETGDRGVLAEVKNGTIGWADENHPVLTNYSVRLCPGDLHVVLGRVATGKSTLLNAVIGEARLFSGELYIHQGSTALVPQEPWVINSTVRDNIIFGLPFDSAWLQEVLEACGLVPDVKAFTHGDLEEIGERGLTLSGGQKQRVCLARAVYAKCPLVLLDDALAKLDPKTALHVYNRLLAPGGLLRNSAVILATNQPTDCRDATGITVLHETSPECMFSGSVEQLLEDSRPELDFLRAGIQAPPPAVEVSEESAPLVLQNIENSGTRSTLMMEEVRTKGATFSYKTLKIYFAPIGGILVAALWPASVFVERAFTVGENFLLSVWSRADSSVTSSEENSYKIWYVVLFACAAVWAVIDRVMIPWINGQLAYGMLKKMLITVACCPMSWFERTPSGRILNRITFDVERLDFQFGEKIYPVWLSFSWIVGAFVLFLIVLGPVFVAVLIPPTICFILLLNFARTSVREVQRLDGLSRSPINSLLLEAVDGGAASIRAFGRFSDYTKSLNSMIDRNAKCILAFNGASRWVAVRTEFIAAFVTFFTALFLALFRQTFHFDASDAGLVLTWTFAFSTYTAIICLSYSLAEGYFTSIERICEYSHDLPQEDVLTNITRDKKFDSWPQSGVLDVKNVCMRYRPGLPLALRDVSFAVGAGERLAVVGKSGAGKSSLAVVLFRIVEIESGSIKLDGVDIATLPLPRLRQALGIITQDAIVFNGTVRYNLDPFGEFREEECISLLEAVHCPLPLDREIDAGEISAGERQLLCLARALLRKPALLISDESTASVDLRTDQKVQSVLRAELQKRPSASLLTIAHRIGTVLDYPRVIRMAEGRVVETGAPAEMF